MWVGFLLVAPVLQVITRLLLCMSPCCQQDYREDRIRVWLDSDDKVARAPMIG